MAKTRCGQLRHIFASPFISLRLKLRLYDAAVYSIFTYGCETWDLSVEVMRTINGANSVMLSHITGKSAREEARPQTTSMNLVRKMRFRRFRWLGHILRSPAHRLIHVALAVQLEMGFPGNLFLDAPTYWRGCSIYAYRDPNHLASPKNPDSTCVVGNIGRPARLFRLRGRKGPRPKTRDVPR